MKFKFLLFTVFFMFMTLGMSIYGQPTEPPLIPIDGGASILLAAGALYGAKKIYDATKRKT